MGTDFSVSVTVGLEALSYPVACFFPVHTSDPYSQFNSQMSDYNAVSNPLWVAPYDNWEEER